MQTVSMRATQEQLSHAEEVSQHVDNYLTAGGLIKHIGRENEIIGTYNHKDIPWVEVPKVFGLRAFP